MEASKLQEKDQQVLVDLLDNVKKQTDLFLGCPVSKDFDYRSLSDFLKYPMNNVTLLLLQPMA